VEFNKWRKSLISLEFIKEFLLNFCDDDSWKKVRHASGYKINKDELD
jgi:hypothetical protein